MILKRFSSLMKGFCVCLTTDCTVLAESKSMFGAPINSIS